MIANLTRKQALLQAIEVLSKNKENAGAVLKLKEMLSEMPLSCWTKDSIIDSIESYASEHEGRLPSILMLTNKNRLPSRTVIESKFHVSSIAEFYSVYFPHLKEQNKSSSRYKDEHDSFFLDTFKDNYERIQSSLHTDYVSTKAFDLYKKEGTPHSATIIKRCGCASYEELLILCGYREPKEEISASVSISYHDEEDEENSNIYSALTEIINRKNEL